MIGRYTLYLVIVLSSVGPALAGDDKSGSAPDVVDTIEHGVVRGAKATEKGLDKAAKATAHGVERGADATAKGLNKATRATEHGVERGAQATAKGLDKAAKATAHGVERGASATGHAAQKVGDKLSGSTTPEGK